MRTPVFTGNCVAIATPFDANGNINYDAFGRLIDNQIEGGVDAICVCGTTGESATMTIREHIAVVEYCVKRVNHRVKVIAGAGSNDTSAAVYLSLHAQDSGADALLHVTPYYNKCSQAGLVKHYEYIADRTELPIILYNVPSRTGLNLLPATLKELAKHENIVGVKEASGDIRQMQRLAALCPCFGVVAVLAPQGTPLQKHHKAHAGAVHRAEGFQRVDVPKGLTGRHGRGVPARPAAARGSGR